MFETAKQVLCCYDGEETIENFYGIACGDIVICACHGEVFNLKENECKILEELPWIDFTDSIRGEELDETYMKEGIN